MEVDVLGRYAVNAALDLGETRERLQRPCPHALGKVGRLDESADVAIGAVQVVVGSRDPELHSSDSVSLDTLDPDLHALEAERDRNATERLELRARVDERSQEHVTGEPADAVQVRDPAQSRPRAIRAAIVPAPSPSSIPTTASAAAHEASIAFNAVVPPCADP